MTCATCGNERPAQSLYCRQCFALFLDVDARTPLEGNEHFVALLDACEALLAGQWTMHHFHNFLQAFKKDLHERESAIHMLDIAPHLQSDFAQEMETGMEGVERCNEALHTLGELEDPDEDRVRRALACFYEGFCCVCDAIAINRANRDRPLWA
jgi:hypothetical protein